MADLAGFHSLLFITWHFETASITHKRESETFVTFSVHVRLTVLKLASLEQKDRRKKEDDDFYYFKHLFLCLYKAELKPEDRLVLRMVRAFCFDT